MAHSKSKQPILFLDYDGVIVDAGSRLITGSRSGFNTVAVGLIERLQVKFNLLVVCSSRAHAKNTWAEQQAVIAFNSSTLKFYLDDDYPYSYRTARRRDVPYVGQCLKYESRGHYVKDWLDLHGYDWTVDTYLMVDDDDDFYPLDTSRYHLVTGSEHRGGFNFSDYIECFNKLSKLTGKPHDGY